MNANEFGDWIKYHRQCHPDFARWADDLDEATRRTQSDVWREQLARISYEAACRVSREMLEQGTHPRWPSEYKTLPRLVLSSLKMTEREFRPHREPTYRCPHCRDTGWRPVYSRSFAAHVLQTGEVDVKRYRTTNVACECQAGSELATTQGLTDSQRFSRAWCDCGWNARSEQSLALLKAWCEDYEDPAVTSYDEFNSWNEGQ